ncbi:putative bifunctional diguanylate cyclase/phosphodiesterase [Nitrospirillum iridis]|uniref:Diguanylate cyclase (GGDEF)-like protein/PAS domain S-box-containing protein n=1 Tax=Nitrospirillum iridis TaxID=765888 RepID=A0A7X0EDT2_9PROT|nr:GGDEF domain-containing phosphodiesterase [Nitrospirillum iridis]MBB6251326.1 diguanylate cyclase (GGDEF)-like protein/PAS domain S-box-containing protein [Nitrospirillum iridis]
MPPSSDASSGDVPALPGKAVAAVEHRWMPLVLLVSLAGLAFAGLFAAGLGREAGMGVPLVMGLGAIGVVAGLTLAALVHGRVRRHEIMRSLVRQRTRELEEARVLAEEQAAVLAMANRDLRVAARVIEHSVDGIMVTDADNRIVLVNRAFTDISGYTEAEVLGHDPGLLNSGRQGPEFYRVLWRALRDEGSWSGEIWNRRKDGTVYPEWLRITLLRDENGDVTHHIAVFSDLTEKKEAEERSRHLAFHDPLTGLANRALLIGRMRLALSASRRTGEAVALLLLDLDHFKLLNDTRGHPVGDAAIVAAGERIRRTVRPGDTVARLGGDEFAVILGGASLANGDGRGGALGAVAHIADRLVAAFQQPLMLEGVNGTAGGGEVRLACSVGVAVAPADGDTWETLLRHADVALYAAKHAGRDRYHFFTPEIGDRVRDRTWIEEGLRVSLGVGGDDLVDGFTLVYQPQYRPGADGTGGALMGAEALLRWNHPEDLSPVSPARFIPVAEETGLIVPLGDWVFRTACRTARKVRDRGVSGFKMAVNLSAVQLRDKGCGDRLRRILEEEGCTPADIALEITESALMGDAEGNLQAVHDLRASGFRFAIDDFGTGYSSLAYLRKFAAAYVKIDKSFVDGLPDDDASRQIVAAVIAMSHHLGLETIAEGIETQAQLDCLRELGCDFIQGYLLGRPMPEAQLMALMAPEIVSAEIATKQVVVSGN